MAASSTIEERCYQCKFDRIVVRRHCTTVVAVALSQVRTVEADQDPHRLEENLEPRQ
jgi:hypothetical protein